MSYPTHSFVNYQHNVPSFLNKIYAILSSNENLDSISWSEDGTAFMILDQNRFCNTVLPLYFKHSNYSSFIRQLNMYDFQKLKNVNTNQSLFFHPKFIRDRQDLLIEVIRKSNSRHPMRNSRNRSNLNLAALQNGLLSQATSAITGGVLRPRISASSQRQNQIGSGSSFGA